MPQTVDLRMQYNAESVFVFEIDNGERYEVVRWTKDELEADPNLPETVELTREMVQESPRGLIEKLYGTVPAWEDAKDNRKLD